MSRAKIYDISTIVLFLIVILLPLTDACLDIDPTPLLQERRKPAHLPTLSWSTLSSYPEQIEKYYNDQFGFRRWLIERRALLLVRALGVSTHEDVALGKEGWLYHGRPSYRPGLTFTSTELGLWLRRLEENREPLARRGIDYLVCFAPSKGVIYPQHFPDSLKSDVTRFEQLLEYLRAHSEVTLLDLRPALKKAASFTQIYYRADGHWNYRGAFEAYETIIGALGKSPYSVSDFRLSKSEFSPQFARRLGLTNIIHEELGLFEPFNVKKANARSPVDPDVVAHRYHAFEQEDESLPRLLMIHDSFGVGLRPLLAEHFERAVFVHHLYLTHHEDLFKILDREKPDLVIHQLNEVHLSRLTDYSQATLCSPSSELKFSLEKLFDHCRQGDQEAAKEIWESLFLVSPEDWFSAHCHEDVVTSFLTSYESESRDLRDDPALSAVWKAARAGPVTVRVRPIRWGGQSLKRFHESRTLRVRPELWRVQFRDPRNSKVLGSLRFFGRDTDGTIKFVGSMGRTKALRR